MDLVGKSRNVMVTRDCRRSTGRDPRRTFLGGRDGVSAIHESSQDGLSSVRGCVGGASPLLEVFSHESPD